MSPILTFGAVLLAVAAINAAYIDSAITDDARRRIERELDLEDARNLHTLRR